MMEDRDIPSIATFDDDQHAHLCGLIASLDSDGPDRIILIGKTSEQIHGRVGILPGSFNPPTNAHIALTDSGREAGLSSILYLLSKRTVDKERVTGIDLADRLSLLQQIARAHQDGVAFTNCGLYVDQAFAFRKILPAAVEIVFLVGFDKIVQIFDARYYHDRDVALDKLFSIATFMVAPREASSHDDLRLLMDTPLNRRYTERVTSIPLAPEHRVLSSTRVRQGISSDVPEVVQDFLKHWRPFDELGPYATRSVKQT